MRDALARVNGSEAFASAPRLQQFLAYVVEETLADRGQNIRSKAIALDVYERNIDEDDAGSNLVRVEARRLRRRLDQYYQGAGSDDPWRIIIDLGGYTPRVEAGATISESSDETERPLVGGRRWIVASLAVAGVTAIVFFAISPRTTTEPGMQRDVAVRSAMRERSAQSLQAINLAAQTRAMTFPLFDMRRQQLALDAYRYVIDLDPGLHHGYAGAAQTLGAMALLSPDRAAAPQRLTEAEQMSSRALELAPDDAWAHASECMGERSLGTAGRRQTRCAPRCRTRTDGRAHTRPCRHRGAAHRRPGNGHGRVRAGPSAFRGRSDRGGQHLGLSNFMMGNYRKAIDIIDRAPASGAAVSPPSLVVLAVSYDNLGDAEKAQRYVDELKDTWPNVPVVALFGQIFTNAPEFAEDVRERLSRNGYTGR